MLILSDFEALTPNLLAKTMETVQGGGIIVILLQQLSSLKQLYTMSMDIHSRFRTTSHTDVVNRFNERFLLSLSNCSCLVLDDELNVLPFTKTILPKEHVVEHHQELIDLKTSLEETPTVGPLVKLCKTINQAKALLTFIEAISEKTLKSTVALTAARGRGKSATLGLSLAAAIQYGYSNIFITSPSPENLKTLFQFVFKGFDALDFQEHTDYSIHQSTTLQTVVRINVFKSHRQTIQYIAPDDYHLLSQAELVVIDEAAAIPLPKVKNMLGPWLCFMASTINGYEGTGRGLSLKLIKQLREASTNTNARLLREVKLEEPIRYSLNDPIESWLNGLLCLDACTPQQTRLTTCPDPNVCDLYVINRDTLFSYHPVSEAFLQRIMSLYVASHYKNSPNDLQLMSDAPAHQLYVLLPPVEGTSLPEPLCVIQVCLEGQISKELVTSQLARGNRPDGDLIPWVLSQQFQDDEFAGLSGARIVRIASHPDYMSMGYGGRALDLLAKYFNGQFSGMDELEEEIVRDEIKIRDAVKMPPLLRRVQDVALKQRLDWMGVSFGITPQLFKFWKKWGYVPVYIRQTPNEITGEHTCIMIRGVEGGIEGDWVGAFTQDFKHRWIEMVSFGHFRQLSPVLVLSILEACKGEKTKERSVGETLDGVVSLHRHLPPFDLKRLESYGNNMLDHHVITDLIPTLAKLYFTNAVNVHLSAVQAAILAGVGLQKKSFDDLEKDLGVVVGQLLALFVKTCRKMSLLFRDIEENEPRMQEPLDNAHAKRLNDVSAWQPLQQSLNDDLMQVDDSVKEKQREMINSLDLKRCVFIGERLIILGLPLEMRPLMT